MGYQTSRPVSEDKSARKQGLVNYVKTTQTINNYCCLTYFFNKIDGNHKDTVWHLSKVLGNVKKKSLYYMCIIINVQNYIFFKKLLWSHFWIDFYKFTPKHSELSIFWWMPDNSPADNSDRDKSARMLRQLGPYYCFIILFNIYMCIIIYLFKRQLLSFRENTLFIKW